MTERTYTYRDTETLISRLVEELAGTLEVYENCPDYWTLDSMEALEAGVFFLRNHGREIPEAARWVLFRADSALSDGCPSGPYWANKPANDQPKPEDDEDDED